MSPVPREVILILYWLPTSMSLSSFLSQPFLISPNNSGVSTHLLVPMLLPLGFQELLCLYRSEGPWQSQPWAVLSRVAHALGSSLLCFLEPGKFNSVVYLWAFG